MNRCIFRVLQTSFLVLCMALCAPVFSGAETGRALKVTSATPKGDVRNLTQITVRFSANMRPLGIMDETARTVPLRLAASGGKLPTGTFRWLDPATLAYIFDKPVLRPVTIRASVPAGTASLTGETLDRELAWEISTPPLTLKSGNPPETTLPRKGAVVYLSANYPLNEKQLKEKSRLTVNGKNLAFTLGKPSTHEYHQGRPSTWRYAYTIQRELPKNGTVALDIAAGLTTENGGDPAPKASFSVPAFGDLRLVQWNIGGYGSARKERNPRPENRLYLYCNNPVRLADLVRHVTVTPEAAAPDMKAYRESRSEGSSFSLPYRWKPRTKYTVTVKPGLKDRFGTTLAKPQTFTFTTGDYQPYIFMPEGSVVNEASLSGRFPLIARNAGLVTARLRLLPWDKDAFRILGRNAAMKRESFENISGVRESTVVMDTATNPNSAVREDIDVPGVLGFAKNERPRGLMTVELVKPEKGPEKGPEKEPGKEPEGDIQSLYAGRTYQASLQVTDLGIAARLGEKQGFAWVTGLGSGKPVPGATVRLLDADGRSLWHGRTNDAGLAVFPGFPTFSAMPRFCMAETANDAVTLDLASSGIPTEKKDYEKEARHNQHWAIHAVTQLSLYQPGQTVNAALYARRHTDRAGFGTMEYADWLPLAGEVLNVSIRDRRGKTVHSFEATTNGYGSVAFSFTLAADAEPGWYAVQAEAKNLAGQSGAVPFQVASFRPPDFKVDVTPPPSEPLPAKKPVRLQATVTAGYFSGALLPDAAVTLEGVYAQSWFKPARLANYTTGPDSSHIWRGNRSRLNGASVAGKLDANGATVLTLPPAPETLYPLDLSLTATVTDAANLASQGTASCLLHPSAAYIGIRAPYIALRNTDVSVMLRGASWDNHPLTGKRVVLTAERVIWDKNGEKFETVWEKKHVLADETGDRVTVSFTGSGVYRLTASIRDDGNRQNVAVTRVYVPGPGLVWPATRYGSHLDLLVEDQTFEPGATAKLVIKNPFDKAWALVSLERDGVRRTLVREVSGTDPVIEVPLEKADAPYVYAAVCLVTGRTAPPPAPVSPVGTGPEDTLEEDRESPAAARDNGAPALYQGSALLRVALAKPELAVTVKTDAEEYRPGTTVRATASVTADGNGKKAQVTFLAVDERILRAGGEHTTYDPSRTFQPVYPNRVHAADIWRLLLDHGRIETGAARMQNAMMKASPMAAMAQDAGLDMTTAAGSSDDSPLIRRNFSPLAFWLAEGETDAAGTLSVTFTLPDTLTGYRVVAVAADRDGGFAHAQASVRAAKPLQLLPALPKFVTEGDRLDAGILVQNTSPGRRKIAVSLTVFSTIPGMIHDQGVRQRSITLEAGRSGLVTFPLTVGMLASPSGTIRLLAEGHMEDDTDAAEYHLPVKPARPVTTVAAAGLLAEGGRHTLPVKAPGNLDPGSRMDVTFAPSPAAGIPLAAKQVIDYPWNCLEQRLSRAWARMIRLEHGEFIGLPPDAGDREAVEKEFAAIPAHQREDGSFVLWPGMTGPDESGLNLFITAYTLLVASEGSDLGFSLPETVRDKALAYVEKLLPALLQDQNGKNGHAFTPAPESLALALRVLALHKPDSAAPLFPAVLAHCEQKKANPLGWGSLLLTLDTLKPAAPADTVARILANLEKTAAITPTHLHFASVFDNTHWLTLGSQLRDNAVILAALATLQPGYPRLEALAAWVGQRIGDTRVLTTQEAAFGLWGLVEYLRSLGGDRETAIRAVWNGRNEASASFGKLMNPPISWTIPAHLLNGGAASNLILHAEKGRPYWTARLSYASPDLPVKMENAGFTLTRTLSSKGPWKIGDTVDVTLTVTIPATRRHVLLFDPFPAGFEPLHATRVDLMAGEKWKTGEFRYGPWQWQDALDDGMLFYASVIHPGTYKYTYSLRAAATGTFTRRPSFVEEMYTPEVFGRTGTETVTVGK